MIMIYNNDNNNNNDDNTVWNLGLIQYKNAV